MSGFCRSKFARYGEKSGKVRSAIGSAQLGIDIFSSGIFVVSIAWTELPATEPSPLTVERKPYKFTPNGLDSMSCKNSERSESGSQGPPPRPSLRPVLSQWL